MHGKEVGLTNLKKWKIPTTYWLSQNIWCVAMFKLNTLHSGATLHNTITPAHASESHCLLHTHQPRHKLADGGTVLTRCVQMTVDLFTIRNTPICGNADESQQNKDWRHRNITPVFRKSHFTIKHQHEMEDTKQI